MQVLGAKLSELLEALAAPSLCAAGVVCCLCWWFVLCGASSEEILTIEEKTAVSCCAPLPMPDEFLLSPELCPTEQ